MILIKLWLLIDSSRYKLQLGSSEVLRKWLSIPETIEDNHLNAPGKKAIKPIIAATISPAMT